MVRYSVKTFYEQVLGFDVIQTSPTSLMIRKSTDHVYVVVETAQDDHEQPFLNHNGLDVETIQEVEFAHQAIEAIKDEWGLRQVMRPRHAHGDTSFLFQDFDGNWWEIVAVGVEGYSDDFGGTNENRDLTGRHELDDLRGSRVTIHTHDDDFRKWLSELSK
jgi:catechol 2,3-dioxygenase-like lactoylglutathione lyase family enzyme